jgi:hypothetical protein
MPRNVDPTLSSTEETEAIKTAALIAARLELLPSEGLRGAEAVLMMLQPCLRESRHSNFTLDAIKFAMTNSTSRRILSVKFEFRWERSKDKKDNLFVD